MLGNRLGETSTFSLYMQLALGIGLLVLIFVVGNILQSSVIKKSSDLLKSLAVITPLLGYRLKDGRFMREEEGKSGEPEDPRIDDSDVGGSGPGITAGISTLAVGLTLAGIAIGIAPSLSWTACMGLAVVGNLLGMPGIHSIALATAATGVSLVQHATGASAKIASDPRPMDEISPVTEGVAEPIAQEAAQEVAQEPIVLQETVAPTAKTKGKGKK